MKSLIFETKDGKTYNLSDLGIRVVEFEPESLDSLNEVTLIPSGGYAVTRLGYGARKINATFRIQPLDLVDYALFRMEIFDLFVQGDDFYVIDEKDHLKKWHVCSDGNFSLDRAIKTGNFDISLLCVNPFAISAYSSLEINKRKVWDDGLFSWNGMIDWDSDLEYSFNSNEFEVSNLGNVEINPRNQMLNITIKAAVSSKLTINNLTTGDVYTLDGSLSTNDTLQLIGTRSFKNGVSVFKDTNRQLLTLNPGVNKFSVTGGTIQSISFDFNYLFK